MHAQEDPLRRPGQHAGRLPSGIAALSDEERDTYLDKYDECPGIFSLMDPLPGALEAYRVLSAAFDTYIVSTAPWLNSSAWSHKLEWVHQHLGEAPGTPAYKRLILSHHKNLNRGDFLVDDRPNNGADRFEGEWLQIQSRRFPDWAAVTNYLMARA